MPGRFPARDIPGGEALRLLGPGLGAVALGLLVRPVEIAGIVLRIPGALLAVLGLMALLLGLSRLAYLRIGALRLRGHVLGALAWRGAETILDIGRPEGAMAAEAAPLLRSGRALVRPPAEIDLPDASVDAVFALDALGPLGPAARRLAAREIARVLRPG
ncbi:MAG TPA: methyltransferase domain-containing protein, partial [Paracoccaceae bacterium]|nr:methyltransferase domain-containing protein [Paracoccaceae bacterium]